MRREGRGGIEGGVICGVVSRGGGGGRGEGVGKEKGGGGKQTKGDLLLISTGFLGKPTGTIKQLDYRSEDLLRLQAS